MGDAKRRKALGLMPTLHPFEVLIDDSGELSFVQQPSGQTERDQLTQALHLSVAVGEQWAQEYRTDYVMAGLPQERLTTREDVEQIPVPTRRRWVGDLAIWPSGVRNPSASDVKVPGTDNTWLHVRTRQHAFENQAWTQLQVPENVEEMLGYLFQHPALQLEGEAVARYRAEQVRGGELTWLPEPPEAQREALDALAREWHGETAQEWADLHAERLNEEPGLSEVPQALRSMFELRKPAPLRSFVAPPFDTVDGLEVFPVEAEQFYSLDGQSWQPYPVPEAAEDDEYGDFNDVETFSATVWSDGRVSWPEDALEAGHAERLRQDLRSYTGAGDPDAWATYAGGVLRSFYDLDDLQAGALPPPRGIRISVPVELYEDLAADEAHAFEAQVIEDELTFDGQTWFDLYEDLPDDLVPAGGS
ncbi:hypothetical protein DKM44_05310 [Deinococcus irradiatisoli]|uniref:Uncharacterized protein n=1 Tax=Deinococcus irradiatisoli TaxID=2202254 RepID=A0A2Z3JGV1_9DEIO|nr:hypothetical protein [Deinococcus irradiatisoli]AWN22721.1 hypothetical protein DKM44_05310 [Deinococcus irradiatisoli]